LNLWLRRISSRSFKPREIFVKRHLLIVIAATGFDTATINLVHAQEAASSIIRSCDGALVKATYNKVDFQYSDWRMADKVDEAAYDQAKKDIGANATIYGVPVGATYGGFQENIKTLKKDRQESYTYEKFRNVAWTGLDENSVTAYQDCLKAAAAAAKKTLVLLPNKATTKDLTFKLLYTATGTTAPNPLPIEWTLGGRPAKGLPKTIPAGATTISVERPSVDANLIVNAPKVGDTDSVVLVPMPPALPPEARLATRCEITNTPPPLPQLAKGGTVSWACPAMLAGDYAVSVSIAPGANIPARVGYSLALESVSNGTKKSFDLPLTSGNVIDINAEAGLPHVFQSLGSTVSLPSGPAVFRLSVGWIFNHCCFSGDGNAGTVSIPAAVSLKMDRLNASVLAKK
jgi:hypothetical protein